MDGNVTSCLGVPTGLKLGCGMSLSFSNVNKHGVIKAYVVFYTKARSQFKLRES